MYNISLYFLDGIVITLGVIFIPAQRENVNIILGEVIFLFANGAIMDFTIFGGLNNTYLFVRVSKHKRPATLFASLIIS